MSEALLTLLVWGSKHNLLHPNLGSDCFAVSAHFVGSTGVTSFALLEVLLALLLLSL